MFEKSRSYYLNITNYYSSRVFLFGVLFLFNTLLTFAQPNNISFKHITPKQGLSSPNITCMLQDSEGFMWFGTEDGLNRFDGDGFDVYSLNVGTDNFTGNYIFDLFEDRNGNLWAPTSAGVVFYNRTAGVFKSYLPNDTILGSISNEVVRNGIEDRNGMLWFGTKSGDINFFIPDSNKFFVFSCNKGSELNPFKSDVADVYEDIDGNIWILYVAGNIINIINPARDSVSDLNLAANCSDLNIGIRQRCILQDRDHVFWVGTMGNGLIRIEKSNDGRYNVTNFEENKSGNALLGNNILSLWEDLYYGLWIAVENGGLSYLDPNKNILHNYVSDAKDENSLMNSSVWSIYQDNDEGLWVGTYSTGINYSNKKIHLINHVKNNPLNENSLSNDIVTSFLVNSKGTLWVGTDVGGLNKYDEETDSFISYNTKNSNIGSNAVLAVIEDSKDNLWVGTWGGGVSCFDREKESFKTYNSENSNLRGNNFMTICEDKNNVVWFGSYWGNGGLNYYDPKSDDFGSYTTDNSNLPENTIYQIILGSDGYLWLATHNGLSKFNSETIEFENFYHHSIDSSTLSHPNVHTLIESKTGDLFMGTASGLNRFNKKTKTFKRFYQNNSNIPNNYINGIVEDDQGFLWITSRSGLSRYNYEKDEIVIYTVSDGVQGPSFYKGSAYKAADGTLYLGGTNGYNFFNPKYLGNEYYVPKMYFSNLKIFNKRIEPGDINSVLVNYDLNYLKELTLTYDKSVFSIEYGCINYRFPEKTQYAFKLEGFEEDWNYVGDKKSATYTNLDPGEYVFKVKIPFKNGVVNEEGISLPIVILPPYYKTLWFRILVISIGILIILVIYYLRVKNIKHQNKILENKVLRRTNEIQQQKEELEAQADMLVQMNSKLEQSTSELKQHKENLENVVESRTSELLKAKEKAEESDRLKSAFLANMSHEIRTPMNAIVGFSNLLANKGLSDETKSNYVSQITSNSNSLLLLIDDILDLSIIESNSLTINENEFDLNLFLDEIYLDSTIRYKNIDLGLKNNLETQNITIKSDDFRIKQILANLINNACKFSDEKGYVELGCDLVSNQIVFYVSDSGIGIAKENLEKIFNSFSKITDDNSHLFRGAGLGLAISKKVADILNGELEVKSELNKGSTFMLKLSESIIVSSSNLVKKPQISISKDWGNKKILIVEDEETNYAYLESAILPTQAKVYWAKNGKLAVELISEGHKYDMILMDLKMPLMNGFEATKLIKEKYPDQIIIAQTAFAQTEDYQKMTLAGFDDILIKPIIPEKLYNKVNRYFY